mmetsp:Transcript_4086/g.11726  ORF Transcript_4086/g.11726 Transcript_4086/m.11726 type:complete len:204 (-) Transcript_4086:512-1123(-)
MYLLPGLHPPWWLTAKLHPMVQACPPQMFLVPTQHSTPHQSQHPSHPRSPLDHPLHGPPGVQLHSTQPSFPLCLQLPVPLPRRSQPSIPQNLPRRRRARSLRRPRPPDPPHTGARWCDRARRRRRRSKKTSLDRGCRRRPPALSRATVRALLPHSIRRRGIRPPGIPLPRKSRTGRRCPAAGFPTTTRITNDERAGPIESNRV